MKTVGKSYADSREKSNHIIKSGASVSEEIDLGDHAMVGLIMPAAWTAAALTVEVSADGTTFTGLAYGDTGTQCNSIAAPAAGAAYALNLAGLLPYRYIRLLSGTTAAPVNQAAERSITVITRPLS